MFRLLVLIISVLGLIILVSSGCREISADRTYALWLEQAPTKIDWQNALPREILVKGGRPHKLKSFTDIDEDTVHASTASCHHGSRVPEPVSVDVRAFYTDNDLFLRLRWEDATRDQGMFDWHYNGEKWLNTGQVEDGFGLMWDAEGQFSKFSCAYACHITDFGVNRANFHASNKMRLTQEDSWLDLWNWKAGRTAAYGFADDRFVDSKGMHGDLPGELFTENSVAHSRALMGVNPFSEGDEPVYDAESHPANEGFHPPGTMAPGYIVKRPVGPRADVVATTRYEDGHWVVILKRALQTGDPRDVVFVPGDEVGVAFGLALMDHSLYEHYASNTLERLVLLKKLSI